MRNILLLLCVLLSALAMGACSASARVTPTATSRATLPPGFVLTTSPDHTFRLAYPAGWQTQTSSQDVFTGPTGQYFEATNDGPLAGAADMRQLVTGYCNGVSPDMAINLVQTTTVRLGGQNWTRGNCDAGKATVTLAVIVEVVIYKGLVFVIEYGSPVASFASDQTSYYALMEQSFHFLM